MKPAPDSLPSLADLQRELQAAREELQAFTYSVSHDLRAPLRHIHAFAQIIEEDWPTLPSEVAQHLATIRQSAQLLTRQLDGLTALSRLGQLPLQPGLVDLPPLLATLVAELMVQQGRGNDRIDWQIAPGLPQPWADAAMLQQVLRQVLDNAIKFSGGQALARIAVSGALQPDGRVRLTVQDNGVGFAAQRAGGLFQVFARLHPAREFDGLGLGLVLCRKLMTRMGGQIGISAQPHLGCQVQLDFAARPDTGRIEWVQD